MKNRFALIGLGNILLRDEGVGVHAVTALQQKFQFSEDLTLLDGGTLGLDLLPYVEGRERLLFIDALDSGKSPGTISLLEDEEVPSHLAPSLSFHQVGLVDLLFALKFKGGSQPGVTLVGVQPAVVETGLALSPKLEEKMETLLEVILQKLGEWGISWKKK